MSAALRAQGGAPSFEQQVREALAAIPHTPGCFDSDYGCACNRDERVALAVVAAIDAAIDEALDAQAFRATLSWSAQAKAERPVDAGRNAALGALGAPRPEEPPR